MGGDDWNYCVWELRYGKQAGLLWCEIQIIMMLLEKKTVGALHCCFDVLSILNFVGGKISGIYLIIEYLITPFLDRSFTQFLAHQFGWLWMMKPAIIKAHNKASFIFSNRGK